MWYIQYYLVLMALSPLMVKIFEPKRRVVYDLIILVCINLFFVYLKDIFIVLFDKRIWDNWLPDVLKTLIYSSYPISFSLCGVFIGKYNIFGRSHSFILQHVHWSLLLSCIVLLSILGNALRSYLYILPFNFHRSETLHYLITENLFCVVLMACYIELFHRIETKLVRKFILCIGQLSTFIWFIHNIIHTDKPYGEALVYWPKEPILVFIWYVFLLVLITYPLNQLYKLVATYMCKIRIYGRQYLLRYT